MAKNVFVGLSGGVDSALSAYLLKKAGYNVTGVFLKVWEPDFLPCTSGQDRLDAMRVAAHLSIPFLTYDLEEEYKQTVVDYFVGEYKEGRTPNPDVMCNRQIKFGSFWEQARADGADAIATGHYAKIKHIQETNTWALFPGVDTAKDQSYFLWTLTQGDLEHVFFPIGAFHKNEVRTLAKKVSLPNASKKDSQGLCFLGHVDMHEFLMHYIPVRRGLVKTPDGVAVGEHDGVQFYTIDQRIPLQTSEKMYVVEKNIEENTLIVSNAIDRDTKGSVAYDLVSTNWIREEPRSGERYLAQIRYHADMLPITISGARVCFEKPVLIAPGQSLVLFDSTSGECIGGGIIERNADC